MQYTMDMRPLSMASNSLRLACNLRTTPAATHHLRSSQSSRSEYYGQEKGLRGYCAVTRGEACGHQARRGQQTSAREQEQRITPYPTKRIAGYKREVFSNSKSFLCAGVALLQLEEREAFACDCCLPKRIVRCALDRLAA